VVKETGGPAWLWGGAGGGELFFRAGPEDPPFGFSGWGPPGRGDPVGPGDRGMAGVGTALLGLGPVHGEEIVGVARRYLLPVYRGVGLCPGTGGGGRKQGGAAPRYGPRRPPLTRPPEASGPFFFSGAPHKIVVIGATFAGNRESPGGWCNER